MKTEKSKQENLCAETIEDIRVENTQAPECPEEKKRSSFKEAFCKLIPILQPVKSENLARNEALYLQRKRKRKIRKMIIFGVFTAIVAAAIILSLLGGMIFPDGTWLGIQARYMRDVLRNGMSSEAPPFFRTFILVTLGYIAITILHFIIGLFAIGNNKRRKTIVVLIASLLKYIGYLVIIIFLFDIWGLSPTVLASIIAALGVAIAFGAQGVISDLLTGLFLIFENSLQVGDIITVDGFRGEVEEIGIRTTKFASVTGDVKVINNSELKKFVNMSMHRSVAVCDFTIEYGENIDRVEQLIADVMPLIAEKYEVITEGPYYKGLVEFNERGVVLRITAKCEEAARLQLLRDINREFKMLFDANNVRLAVPKVQLVTSDSLPGALPSPVQQVPLAAKSKKAAPRKKKAATDVAE